MHCNHRFFLRSAAASAVALAIAGVFAASAESVRGAPSGNGSGAEEEEDEEEDEEEEADAVEAMCQMSCTMRQLYARKVMPTALAGDETNTEMRQAASQQEENGKNNFKTHAEWKPSEMRGAAKESTYEESRSSSFPTTARTRAAARCPLVSL
jgi:hypothetical protein